MTHFEYIATAHTLILTFAAARFLGGVAHAVDPRRIYWVHLSWLGLAIMFSLIAFWVFWSYRDVEWTLPRLIVALAPPALIYVFLALLVPNNASEVSSWREHFFRIRVPLFASGVLMVASICLSNQVFLDISPAHEGQVALYALLAIFAIGAISAKPRLHTVLAFAPPLLIARALLSTLARSDLGLR